MDKNSITEADNWDTDSIGAIPGETDGIGSTPRETDGIGSTPFDDVYRTLTTKITKLVIPLINEMFGTTYAEDEPIRQISNEHYTRNSCSRTCTLRSAKWQTMCSERTNNFTGR